VNDGDVKNVWRGCDKVEGEWRMSVVAEMSWALMI
jgi:hypothetical protein